MTEVQAINAWLTPSYVLGCQQKGLTTTQCHTWRIPGEIRIQHYFARLHISLSVLPSLQISVPLYYCAGTVAREQTANNQLLHSFIGALR